MRKLVYPTEMLLLVFSVFLCACVVLYIMRDLIISTPTIKTNCNFHEIICLFSRDCS